MSSPDYGGDDYGDGEYGGSTQITPSITQFDVTDASWPGRSAFNIVWAVDAGSANLDTVNITLHNEAGYIVEAVAVNVEGKTASAEHSIDTWGAVDRLRFTVSTRSNEATTTVLTV